MKRHFVFTCSLLLLAGLNVSAQETNPVGTKAQTLDRLEQTTLPSSTSNLLYIIPKERLESFDWSAAENTSTNEEQEESPSSKSAPAIFYLKEFASTNEESRITEPIGSDWVVVPVDENKSLFRLIATHLPEETETMPPLHVDVNRYHLEQTIAEPSWPNGVSPRSVMLHWAEWWQTETNATPVVLILIRY